MTTNRIMRSLAVLCLTLALSLVAGQDRADAQSLFGGGQSSQSETDSAATAGETPADPLGRDTPRGMVDGLIGALASGDPAAVLPYLDLSQIPEARRDWAGRRAAVALQNVLDRRGAILPGYRLSTAPAGNETDRLPADEDVFATVRTDTGEENLTAHRVTQPDGTQIWQITPQTLTLVQSLSTTADLALVDRIAPQTLQDFRVLGVRASHWIASAVVAALSLVLAFALVAAGFGLLRSLWPLLRAQETRHVVRRILFPLAVLLATMIFRALAALAGISVVARSLLAPFVEAAGWLALAWLIWRVVDALSGVGLSRMNRRGRLGAISVVTMVRRALKILIFVLAAAAIFSAFGVNLTGWLAAFGLGGLAFALGAQKTIEQFVGSLTIIADQPIRVGDFCQVDGLLGTVEDIGMRSTRIRTLDRTLVTIPNGMMSTARIENFASRDRFLFKVIVGVTYDTDPAKMRTLLDRLRRMLDEDGRLIDDPRRVRFVEFGPSSLDIEIFTYAFAADFSAFLEIKEDLNLKIMEIVADAGTSFAFPSQSVYLHRAEGGGTAQQTD